MKKAPLLAILALSFVVAGCSNVVTASRDKPIDDNRGTRTLGSTVDDALIETKAAVNIAKASPGLADSHIVVVSYNGVVLIAGQVPRADLKPLAEQAVRSVQRVKTVHDELQVTANSSMLARSNDAWLTTRIKTQMFADEDIPGSRIKVVTENGIVYLLGLVTQQEAAHAVQLIQSVSGVQRIVKLFEYIN